MTTAYTATTARSIVDNARRLTGDELAAEIRRANVAQAAARPGGQQAVLAGRVARSLAYEWELRQGRVCARCAGTPEEHTGNDTVDVECGTFQPVI